MRIERGLSQDGLAALMPPFTRGKKTTPRTNSWVSYIETGKQEPGLADLQLLAEALQVDVRWLLSGEASGMTEFTARMSEMELQMDWRAVQTVIGVAMQQVEILTKEREQGL